jgi:hypothetical protein
MRQNVCLHSSTELRTAECLPILFSIRKVPVSNIGSRGGTQISFVDVVVYLTRSGRFKLLNSRGMCDEWRGAKTTYSCSSDRYDIRLNLSSWPEWWVGGGGGRGKMAAGRICHELRSWLESKLQRGQDPVFEHRCWVGYKPIRTWRNVSSPQLIQNSSDFYKH